MRWVKGRAGRYVLLALAAAVVVALGLLVREVKRVPPRAGDGKEDRAETNPLTDVAGRPRVRPPAATSIPVPGQRGANGEAPPPDYVLPDDMPDPANPPQPTKPLAMPGEPVPPDPFQEPEIAQDPNRGGRTQ